MNKLSKILRAENLRTASVYERLKRLNSRWDVDGDQYVLKDRRGRPMGYLYSMGWGTWTGELMAGATFESTDYEEAAEWVQDNG